MSRDERSGLLEGRCLFVLPVRRRGLVTVAVLFWKLFGVNPLQRDPLEVSRNGRVLFFILCHGQILGANESTAPPNKVMARMFSAVPLLSSRADAGTRSTSLPSESA